MIRDMPKLESPFVREDGICIPKIVNEHRWVFTHDCTAVDKLHGTNVSVLVQRGLVTNMYNRAHQVGLFSHESSRFYTGITRAIEKGYFIPGVDGQYFGELIGAGTQGNCYQIAQPLWLPFNYLKEKYHYKFWPGFVNTLIGKSTKEIFNDVSNLFKNLWSIYKNQIGFSGNKDVDENTGFIDCAAEGIVFYHSDGRMCKLRRDMFDWFKGKR